MTIAEQVAAVRSEIAAACARSGRDADAVAIVAVTKTQGPEVLAELRAAGIRDYGENRLEHLAHMQTAAQPGDRWHFIGRVQGRQLAEVAARCDVLHSLCDPGHLDRLARAVATRRAPLTVYLQANISGEQAKAGLPGEALAGMADQVRRIAGVELAGLMTMAPELETHAEAGQVRACFAGLRARAHELGLTGLSMGMSGDFPIAVEEGATVVRVGSRLFS
jgi:pyridoxal phosphate enzyme (YggS family)